MNGKNRITVIGHAIMDILAGPVGPELFENNSVPVEEVRFSFGGNALNEAIVLNRLGCDVQLISKVGRDDAGNRILRMLESSGVSTDRVVVEDGLRTSVNLVLYDHAGERRFLTDPAASQRRLREQDLVPMMDDLADIVCFSCMFVSPPLDIPAMHRLFRIIKGKPGRVLAVDMTQAKHGETIEALKPLLPLIDYFLPNESELCRIGGDDERSAVAALLENGVGCIVVKKGAAGCTVCRKDQCFDSAAFVPARVVDTTGAGDTFAAGFLYGLSSGLSLEQCAHLANAAASFCVESAGATNGVPALDKIEERIRTGRRLVSGSLPCPGGM